MSEIRNTIVWIDHSEATVSRFRGGAESDVAVQSHAPLQRLHHLRTGWEAGGNVADNTDFYQRIAVALDGDGDVVITGPGTVKLEFKAYLDQHRPHITSRVETATPGRAA